MDDKLAERIAVALERIADVMENVTVSSEGEPLTVAESLNAIASSLQTAGGADLADVVADIAEKR